MKIITKIRRLLAPHGAKKITRRVVLLSPACTYLDDAEPLRLCQQPGDLDHRPRGVGEQHVIPVVGAGGGVGRDEDAVHAHLEGDLSLFVLVHVWGERWQEGHASGRG